MVVIILMSPQNSVNETLITILYLVIVVILIMFFITKPNKNSNEVVDSVRQNSDVGSKLIDDASINKINHNDTKQEITCSHCGNRITKEDLFCGNCGNKVCV